MSIAGEPLPRICFFADKAIAAGTELTWSYGATRAQAYSNGATGGSGTDCLCGAELCGGLLPG